MIRTLSGNSGNTDNAWLGAFARDFHKRFLFLLSYQFRAFPSVLALSIIESANAGAKLDTLYTAQPLTKSELDASFSPFDLKRLDSYANNMLDYHVILDMIPAISHMYFTGRLKPAVSMTGVQSSILLAIGLQRKVLEDVEKELGLPASQLLAMFVKIVRKVSAHFRRILEGAVEESLPQASVQADEDGADEEQPTRYAPLKSNLDDELREGGEEVDKELKEKQRALIDALPLDKYEVETGAAGWDEAEKHVKRAHAKGGEKGLTVSVKSSKSDKKRKGESAEDIYREEIGDKEVKRLKKGMNKAR
jgi:N-acetyltransferase 10